MYVYEKIQLEKNYPIKLISIDTEDCLEIYREEGVKKHWHRSLEIIIPLEGMCELWTSHFKTIAKAGDIYIINSREIHSIANIKDVVYKGYAIQIRYDYLLKCYPDMESIYFNQIISEDVKLQILYYIDKISSCWGKEDEYIYLRIESYLLQIVYILLYNQKKKKDSRNMIKYDTYIDRINAIINFIDENYKDNLSVAMLADKFNLSYAHLARLFKENTQMTIKEYMNKVRLKKCEEYLADSNYPIIQIAMDNGFPNIQSFYKEFKKEYLCTPLEYRKNAIK